MINLDERMRAMPISTKEEAVAFMVAFSDYCWQNNPYGTVLPKNHKAASVRSPDIFQKAMKAEEIAGQCYWQMTYEEAAKKFYGLPKSKWESERIRRGIK